jgi:hypothetical protein
MFRQLFTRSARALQVQAQANSLALLYSIVVPRRLYTGMCLKAF